MSIRCPAVFPVGAVIPGQCYGGQLSPVDRIPQADGEVLPNPNVLPYKNLEYPASFATRTAKPLRRGRLVLFSSRSAVKGWLRLASPATSTSDSPCARWRISWRIHHSLGAGDRRGYLADRLWALTIGPLSNLVCQRLQGYDIRQYILQRAHDVDLPKCRVKLDVETLT